MISRRQCLKLTGLVGVFSLFAASNSQADALDRFFFAVRRDDEGALRQWLELGMDPNLINESFTPAIVLALQQDSLKAAALLLQSPKIKLEATNLQGETALMIAAIRGHQDLVQAMLAKGAQVNRTGWTALHYAASGGHSGIIRLLLEAHAYIDAESPNGSTPLMMAAQYGSPESVKLLLEEGADVTLKNRVGYDALEFAKLGNRPDSIEIIHAFLAAIPPKK
jgi:uncharacterized protein